MSNTLDKNMLTEMELEEEYGQFHASGYARIREDNPAWHTSDTTDNEEAVRKRIISNKSDDETFFNRTLKIITRKLKK